MFYFLLILLFLLIVPIPINLKATFKKGEYSISIYNFILFSNNDGFLKRFLNKKNAKDNTINSKKEIKEKKESKFNLNIKKLFSNINNNKFKPRIKFYANLDYSLSDAANTAILFGFLCNLNPILYKVFSIVFSIKDIKLNIVPKFKNMILLEFSIKSIITLNLAQIIYMLFLILISFRREKEVYPEKDSYVR